LKHKYLDSCQNWDANRQKKASKYCLLEIWKVYLLWNSSIIAAHDILRIRIINHLFMWFRPILFVLKPSIIFDYRESNQPDILQLLLSKFSCQKWLSEKWPSTVWDWITMAICMNGVSRQKSKTFFYIFRLIISFYKIYQKFRRFAL
jgi:hypothetical protein